MFSEILKIIPKLDQGALGKMERSLGQRFGKIAKKFGSGLKSAIMGGGITALALGVIDKILNPLKETQDAIDGLLNRVDDLDTMATEFNTSPANLLKLQTIAQAKGLDPETLSMLMGKFQVAVSEALRDPSKDTSVRNFAVAGADNADMFFRFVQAVQKLSKQDQLAVQSEVFGEKQILKASEFMNEKNLPGLMNALSMPNSHDLNTKLGRTSKLADEEQLNAARRSMDDIVTKIQLINEKMISNKDQNERLKMAQENKKISFQDSMVKVDNNMIKIQGQLEMLLLNATKGVTNLDQVIARMDKIPAMKMLRGVLGFGKEGK